MSNDVLIRVDGLERYYGDTPAVRGISLEVRRGEVLGFLGPNGAGKSTTMQIIAGALAPSAGQVVVNGADILDRPLQAKRQVGYLPEQPPLYRELTVDEYLAYCGRLRAIPRAQLAAAVKRARERCGLGQSGRRLIGNLSKGYQQRVGIAQAIIHSPAVVILDEPTVGLDPIQIREIRALIRELGGEHSVILSTHILPEVQAVCDRVQIIHDGRLVLDERLDRLALGADAPCIRLGLRHPPADSELLAIPGVMRVERTGEGRLLAYRGPDLDPTDELVRRAAAEHWGLYELGTQQRSLEELFVELTLGESRPAEAA
jgi:ABC-2 type transport system ATP-binding protein